MHPKSGLTDDAAMLGLRDVADTLAARVAELMEDVRVLDVRLRDVEARQADEPAGQQLRGLLTAKRAHVLGTDG